MTKFYAVWSENHLAQNSKHRFGYVCDTPELTNMSKKPLVLGWLGTTNDQAYYALGEFDNLDDAAAAIAAKADEPLVRSDDWDVVSDPENWIATYRPAEDAEDEN